jgi:hypothetical protein
MYTLMHVLRGATKKPYTFDSMPFRLCIIRSIILPVNKEAIAVIVFLKLHFYLYNHISLRFLISHYYTGLQYRHPVSAVTVLLVSAKKHGESESGAAERILSSLDHLGRIAAEECVRHDSMLYRSTT